MDANNRIEDLILITGRLAELLERENEALVNRESAELHEVLDEKVTLSRVYETRMQALAERPELLDEVDAELREKLAGLGKQVSDLIEQNGKLLKTAIDTNRRVVELVAEAVRGATPSAGTYGAGGTTDVAGHRAESKGIAISLDQTL